MKRRIPATCVLLVTVASIAVLTRDGGRPPARRRATLGIAELPIARAEAAPGSVAATSDALLRFGYAAGMRLVYRVERSYAAVSTLPALPGAAPRHTQATISVEGTLTLTVLSREGDVALLSTRLLDVSFRGATDGRDLPAVDASELEGALATETLARVASDGEVLEVGFAPAMPARARDVVKGLLLSLHLRLPRDRRAEWTADEADLTGAARVSYSVEPGHVVVSGREARRITRRRGSYALPRGKDSGSATAIAAFAPREGVVVALEGEELFACADERSGYAVRANGSTRFELVKLDHVGVAASARGEVEWRSASTPEGTATRNRRLSRATSVTALALDMERLFLAEDRDSSALCQAVRDIVALLQADAAAVREARDLAWRDLASERVRKQLLCCLGMAGTAEAQAVLVEAIQDGRMTEALHRTALIAMTQVTVPSAELEAAARRVAEDASDVERSRQALLVLGQMGHRLLEGAPERAAGIRAFLEGRYTAAASVEDRVAALEALGNAGDPAAEGLLGQAAGDADAHVRAAAMTGLRRVGTRTAAEALEAGLEDSAQIVREAARSALAGNSGASITSTSTSTPGNGGGDGAH